MKTRKIVLMTIVLWLVATSCYCYYWVTSILAQPDTYGYEQLTIFPLMGFLYYRFPYLVVGLVLLISVELISLAFIRRNVKVSEMPRNSTAR
jgi:hypothetical protein